MKPHSTTPPGLPAGDGAPPSHLVSLIASLIAADLVGQPKAEDLQLVELRLVEFLVRAKTHPYCERPSTQAEAAEREHMGCAFCGTGIYATPSPTAHMMPRNAPALPPRKD